VLPGESTKQNGGSCTLVCGECPLNRAMKMLGLVESRNLTQARAFSF